MERSQFVLYFQTLTLKAIRTMQEVTVLSLFYLNTCLNLNIFVFQNF